MLELNFHEGVRTINDCKCNKDYEKLGQQCVPKSTCSRPTFPCPRTSRPKRNKDCKFSKTVCLNFMKHPMSSCLPLHAGINSFNDCECIRGYERSGHQCVPEPTCSRPTFPCPRNSRPKRPVDCKYSRRWVICTV